jgi:ankyrin repeat protein
MHAAFIGDVPRLQELMGFGENVKSQNNRGKTALSYAIQGGKLEAVRFLVRYADLEDMEMGKLRINNRIAKIDVDLDPRSGFKGNSEMLRTEKATLNEIYEILTGAITAASQFPRGGSQPRKEHRKSRKNLNSGKTRKIRKSRKRKNY